MRLRRLMIGNAALGVALGSWSSMLGTGSVAAAYGIPLGKPWQAMAVVRLLGLVLAVQVQRGLTLAATTVERLQRGLPASPAPVQAGWPVAALLEQISALGASETQLGAVREQLLHQTAAAAAQEERNRLARDLHDSIKQQIFAISVSAAAVQARWDQDPDGARTALAEVRRSAQEAMVELRAMLQQLRPAPLESVGLVEALRDQGQALAYRTGAKVDLNPEGLAEEERLPVGAQESLFRIAQEAFANVARHARASHVRVGLGVCAPREREMLLLEVDDDGQGFEPLHVPTSGVGLSNMSERIRVLQGTLEVRSALGLAPPSAPASRCSSLVPRPPTVPPRRRVAGAGCCWSFWPRWASWPL